MLWALFLLFILVPAILILIYTVFKKGSLRVKRYTLFGIIVFYVGWFIYLWSAHLIPSMTA